MSFLFLLACGGAAAAGQSFTDPADVPLLTEFTASFVISTAEDLLLVGGASVASAPLTSLRSGSPGQHSTAALSVPLSPGTTLTGLSLAYRYNTGYGHAGDGKTGSNFSVSVTSGAAAASSTPVYGSPHLVDFDYDHDRSNYSAPIAVDVTGLSIPIAQAAAATKTRIQFAFDCNERNLELLLPLVVNVTCTGGPCAAPACVDDCSLNGECVSDGVCACDAPWHGAACGLIGVEPAQAGGLYGYSPNVSSWGGNAVLGDDGMHHLYVAEMATGGLKAWASQSECTHAVSGTAQGPFTKTSADGGEALPKWCHNPYTLRDSSTGRFLMFHIGSSNDTDRQHDFLHAAASPFGPWTAAPSKPQSCNNPAPAFHPNGTLFAVCNHQQITRASGAPLSLNTSWSELATMQKLPAHGTVDRDRHWEDPSLWFDRRGNWHVLYHVYCLRPFAERKECMSGHAFSRDGESWTFSNVEPFNGTVSFVGGSPPITFSTRERPHVVFAPEDANRTTPIGVTTGVSSQQPNPSCDACYKGACSQCKITTGRDWVYTVLQPFAGWSSSSLARA